jgi:hypothetical protein
LFWGIWLGLIYCLFSHISVHTEYQNRSIKELETLPMAFPHTMLGNVTLITVAPILRSSGGDPRIGSPFARIPINANGLALQGSLITPPIPPAPTQCSDNIDNDGDLLIDLADPGCVGIQDNDETDAVAFNTSDPSLVTYISFDDNSRQGLTYDDLSSHANNLALISNIPTTQAVQNQGAKFNGRAEYGRFMNYTPFNFGGQDFTIGLWFKADQVTTRGQLIGYGVEPGGPNPYGGFALYIHEGRLTFRVSDTQSYAQGNRVYWVMHPGIKEGEWYHVIAERAGSQIRLYLNGELQEQIPIPTNYQVRTLYPTPVGVGVHLYQDPPGAYPYFFNGTIDELTVFNRSLSQQEINSWYDTYGYPRGFPIQCHDYDFYFGVSGQPINDSWRAIYLSSFPAIEQFKYTSIGAGNFVHYPYIDAGGTPYYGGIPQHANLTDICNGINAEITYRLSTGEIPSTNYSGLEIIDMEYWHFLWEQQAYFGPAYLTLSRQNVSAEFPSWNATQIETEAKRRYEEAARNVITSSINCVRQRLPNARIGLYGYPEPYDSSAGYNTPQRYRLQSENDELDWLWSQLDVISPWIYLIAKQDYVDPLYVGQYTPESFRQITKAKSEDWVMGPIREAVRISQNHGGIPIIPFTVARYFDQSGQIYALNLTIPADWDIESQVPYDEGADGIIIWGHESFSHISAASNPSPEQWDAFGPYIRDVVGPRVQAIKAQTC